jgi:hypothetical protein
LIRVVEGFCADAESRPQIISLARQVVDSPETLKAEDAVVIATGDLAPGPRGGRSLCRGIKYILCQAGDRLTLLGASPVRRFYCDRLDTSLHAGDYFDGHLDLGDHAGRIWRRSQVLGGGYFTCYTSGEGDLTFALWGESEYYGPADHQLAAVTLNAAARKEGLCVSTILCETPCYEAISYRGHVSVSTLNLALSV